MASISDSVALTPSPDLRYNNLEAAVSWIGDTFGFAQHCNIKNANGELGYIEVSCGSGKLILGRLSDEADPRDRGSTSSDKNSESQSCCVLIANIDDFRTRVERAGVEIVFDSRSSSSDSNSFICRDLEGNLWFFGDDSDEAAESFPVLPDEPAMASPSRSWVSIPAIVAALAGAGALLLLLGTGVAGLGQTKSAVNSQFNDKSEPRSNDRKARLLAEQKVHELKTRLQENTKALEQIRAAVSRTEQELRVERSRRRSAENTIGEIKSIKLKLGELREQIHRTAALSAGSDLSQASSNGINDDSRNSVAPLVQPPKQISSPKDISPAPARSPGRPNGKFPSVYPRKQQPHVRRRPTWRLLARQRSTMSEFRSLTARLRPDRMQYHSVGVKIRRRDVNIRSVRVLYRNGTRQILPLSGVIRDESGMRTFRLRSGRGGPRRVTVQHQSTFNTKGPGSVEIWVRRSELPRQKSAAR
ncbi:MAG: hypothetical protein ACR2OV_07050 [Hyphomicrobiaceae bacterium]